MAQNALLEKVEDFECDVCYFCALLALDAHLQC